MLEKVLSVLYTFYTKQNTSDIITFPIKFENKDYYLYIIDCIKCLLQEMLNQYLTDNIDNNNLLTLDTIEQDYKNYIIKFGPQLNKNIKDNLIQSADKIKSKYDNDFVYKLVTTDELFILTTLNTETLIEEIKKYFIYNLRIYKVKCFAVNNIQYELYVI